MSTPLLDRRCRPSRVLGWVFASLWAVIGPVAWTADLVIWHSQPVRPGQSVLLYGDGLEQATVEGRRLDDAAAGLPRADTGPAAGPGATAWTVLQPRRHALKVVVPPEASPGVFALTVTSGGRRQEVRVNAPEVWWARGAEKLAAEPGGEVRVFGLGLGWSGVREALAGTPPGTPQTRVVLQGARVVELMASEADLYSARATLPLDVPPGDYDVWVHNGCGGPAGWGRCPQPLTVRAAEPWPSVVHNALRNGALGDGKADDTDAVQGLLDRVGREGGGVVYLPPGEYRFSRTLFIPRRVLVRGAGRDSTLMYWTNPHFEPMRGVIRGECHFGLENLTVWYVGAQYGINNMAETDRRPGGGNALYSPENRPAHWQEGDIVLRGVVVRWQPYVGRPGWGQLDDRLSLYRKLNAPSLDSAGKGVAVWLCGRDIRIEDCDILSGGFPLLFSFFSDGSVVRNNTLHIGSGGLVWAARGRQCIWENNRMLGGETSRAGWSTKANPYYDQNYVRGNTVAFSQTADYEIFGSDGSSPVYYGAVATSEGTRLTLAKPPRRWNWEPGGHLVFVLKGSGRGQARWVVDATNSLVEVDRPWTIPLDATSVIGINHSLRQWLVVGNRFADGNSMQMYGLSHEVVFAENELERVGGSEEASLRFIGFQHVEGLEGTEPSYFCQMLGNRAGGARLDARRFQSGGNALELIGGDPPADDPSPCLMTAAVLRGNHVRSGTIRLWTGGSFPTLRAEDVVIEGNHVQDSAEGLFLGARTAGVLVRSNRMERVRIPLVGPGVADAWIDAGSLARYPFEAFEGLVRRLSLEGAVDVAALRADAGVKSTAGGGAMEWEAFRGLAARAVARGVPAPHHPDVARLLMGASITPTGGGSLFGVLERDPGGEGTLDVSLSNEGAAPWTARIEPQWPKGWEGQALEPVVVPPRTTKNVALRARAPAGAWGAYAFPARVQVTMADATLAWDVRLTAGSGAIGEWRVTGPDVKGRHRNRTWTFDEIPSAPPAPFVATRPAQWDFSAPVTLGGQPRPWLRVEGSTTLELARRVEGATGVGKDDLVAAYAACVLECDADVWVEFEARHDGPRNTHDIQFYLDGEERPDLRLGRESWSPKRLPLKLSAGRHVMLVDARDKAGPPPFSLAVRELGNAAGGHVRLRTP